MAEKDNLVYSVPAHVRFQVSLKILLKIMLEAEKDNLICVPALQGSLQVSAAKWSGNQT